MTAFDKVAHTDHCRDTHTFTLSHETQAQFIDPHGVVRGQVIRPQQACKGAVTTHLRWA